MGEMRETLVDVSEAFSTYFEEKKLPVLHITKFDMIGDTEETTQVKAIFHRTFRHTNMYFKPWLNFKGVSLLIIVVILPNSFFTKIVVFH